MAVVCLKTMTALVRHVQSPREFMLTDSVTRYPMCAHVNREVCGTWRESRQGRALVCLVCQKMQNMSVEDMAEVNLLILAPFFAHRRECGTPAWQGKPAHSDAVFHSWVFT